MEARLIERPGRTTWHNVRASADFVMQTEKLSFDETFDTLLEIQLGPRRAGIVEQGYTSVKQRVPDKDIISLEASP